MLRMSGYVQNPQSLEITGFAAEKQSAEFCTWHVDNFVDIVENTDDLVHSLWILWISLWTSVDKPVDYGV